MATIYGDPLLPSRYLDIKQGIAKEFGQDNIERSWRDVLDQLAHMTAMSEKLEHEMIPQIDFKDLDNIDQEKIKEIKSRGAVVVRNVVPDEEALKWKEMLREYVKANKVSSYPENDRQFFMLYWAKSQVQARAHPNVLKTQVFLNNFYSNAGEEGDEAYNLSKPLSYADRFRIRNPGGHWNDHKPHIDGGGIERWEDLKFRECFKDIFSGNWERHDPYDLSYRLDANNDMYNLPTKCTIFRTFQGWLALSSTGPGEGTLRVFPSVRLSNAYLILRPFFRLKANPTDNILAKENWEYDVSTPIFPGIYWQKEHNWPIGPRLTDEAHPHLRLDKGMVSVPKVDPGDMVFWHTDVIHSVEPEHHGNGDSSVIYISSVPTTPCNTDYIVRQLEHFKMGMPPPDYPQTTIPEGGNHGVGTIDDLGEGSRAMGIVGA